MFSGNALTSFNVVSWATAHIGASASIPSTNPRIVFIPRSLVVRPAARVGRPPFICQIDTVDNTNHRDEYAGHREAWAPMSLECFPASRGSMIDRLAE